MNNPEQFFTSMLDDQHLLKAHGFDDWPVDEELARYLFAVEEKIDLLANINGVQLERDARGRLHAYRRQEAQSW